MFGQSFPNEQFNLSVKHNSDFNVVFDIVQTKNGQLITSTEQGVYSYNGMAFSNVFNFTVNAPIGKIVEADQGFYGINFNQEIIYYNGLQCDTIFQFKSQTHIYGFIYWNRHIYISEPKAIYQLNPRNGQLDTLISDLPFYIVTLANENQIPLGIADYKSKVAFYDIQSRSFNSKLTSSNSELYGKKLVSKWNDDIILFNHNGLFIHTDSIWRNVPLEEWKNNEKPLDILPINSEYLGLGTSNGFKIYDKKGHLISHTLINTPVNKIFEDSEGQIWLGTANDGLFLIPSLQLYTQDLKSQLNKYEKIIQSTVVGEQLYLGTYSGQVLHYNMSGDFVESIKLNNSSEIQSFNYLPEKNQLAVFCEKLYLIDCQNFKISDSIEVTATKNVCEYQSQLYLATSSGLFTYQNKQLSHQIKHLWMNTLCIDQTNQMLWMGIKGGVGYTQLTDTTHTFHKIPAINHSVYFSHINSHNQFIGISGLGQLYQINPLGELIFQAQIPTENRINAIDFISDDSLIYAASGNAYLYVISTKESKAILPKSIENNAVINIFHQGSKSLQLVYPTHYLTIENYLDIHPKNIVPHLQLLNQNQLISSQFSLPFENDGLHLQVEIYPNYQYNQPLDVYYSFGLPNTKLNEIKLSVLNGKYNIDLPKLNSGEYELNILVPLGHQVYKKQFHITVKKAFWEQWWFKGLIVILILIILILIYKRLVILNEQKNQKLIEEERIKRKLINFELTSIRSQMNPHFIFNVLSLIQMHILEGHQNKAYQNINHFSKLLRNVLDKSKEEFVLLEKEIEILTHYMELEKDRMGTDFSYDLHIDESIDLTYIKIPTLITQPFVENAIQHGLMHKQGAKKLHITIKESENQLCIYIEDNGIGLDQSKVINQQRKNHQSFGIKAIKNRINRINEVGDVYIDYQIVDLMKESHQSGTRVKLTIKYLNE